MRAASPRSEPSRPPWLSTSSFASSLAVSIKPRHLLQRCDVEAFVAALPRAEQFAAAAQAQILFGQLEAVLRAFHQLQAASCPFRTVHRRAAAGRSIFPRPAPHGRAAGGAGQGRSVRPARSPSAWHWAHPRPLRSRSSRQVSSPRQRQSAPFRHLSIRAKAGRGPAPHHRRTAAFKAA